MHFENCLTWGRLVLPMVIVFSAGVQNAKAASLYDVCTDPSLKTDIQSILSRGVVSTQTTSPRQALSGLRGAARMQRELGHYEDAERAYGAILSESLTAAKGTADIEVATSLEDLALLHRWQSRYASAKNLLSCALSIRDQMAPDDKAGQAIGLAYLAELDGELGLLPQAKKKFEASLTILQTVGVAQPSQLSYVSTGLAHVLWKQGSPRDAEPYYRMALANAQKDVTCTQDCISVAISHDNLGRVLMANGKTEEAEVNLQTALQIKEQRRGLMHDSTATTVNSLAHFYDLAGNKAQALANYRRAALSVYQPLVGRSASWATMSRFAEFSSDLANALAASGLPVHTNEAIYYYKLSVLAREKMRQGASEMDEASKTALTSTVSDPYYRLAGLLSRQGRIAEAEQTLLALKDDEFLGFTRGVRTAEGSAIVLTPEEMRITNELNEISNSLGLVYAELEANRLGRLPLNEEALKKRQDRRDFLQSQLIAKLDETSARLRGSRPENAGIINPRDTQLTRLAQSLTSKSGSTTVILAYVAEERTSTVLVFGPSGPTAVPLPVGRAVLNPLIEEMRLAVRQKGPYTKVAQQLHGYLIEPVEAHFKIQGLKPKTLMLYLADRLRYLPFAALMDANGGHLIENYQLAVLTTASRKLVDADPISDWSITAFGSTKSAPSEKLPPLPFVKTELDSIVRTPTSPKGTLPGKLFLDDEFTRDAWQGMLSARPGETGRRNNVVHVATHFLSRPGDWRHSFLLLGGDARYELSELENALSINLEDVDLLTLSACSTELTDMADGSEFEGLGVVFQSKGARSVIGTLWQVQDLSGSTLMSAFYEARGEKRQMSKAAALQQAQVQLLSGRTQKKVTDKDLSHPYYWAPFILMGNWL